MRRLLLVTLLAGCGATFQEIDPGAKKAGEISATCCGATTVTAGGIIKAMDEPPVGPGGSEGEKPKPLRVCVELANHGAQPVRVDRSHLRLDTMHGKESWIPDQDDEAFVVPAGSSRTFHVDFESNLVLSGEDVKVRLDDGISVSGRAAHLPPIVLRKK
jgi:hypothetical protein